MDAPGKKFDSVIYRHCCLNESLQYFSTMPSRWANIVPGTETYLQLFLAACFARQQEQQSRQRGEGHRKQLANKEPTDFLHYCCLVLELYLQQKWDARSSAQHSGFVAAAHQDQDGNTKERLSENTVDLLLHLKYFSSRQENYYQPSFWSHLINTPSIFTHFNYCWLQLWKKVKSACMLFHI